jgi:hypothetical protein
MDHHLNDERFVVKSFAHIGLKRGGDKGLRAMTTSKHAEEMHHDDVNTHRAPRYVY